MSKQKKRRKFSRIGDFRHKIFFYVFAITLIYGIISCGFFAIFNASDKSPSLLLYCAVILIALLVAAIFIALLISSFYISRLFKPLEKLTDAAEQIAEGDLSVHIDQNDGESQLDDLIKSFNHMTDELKGIELFRKDFINNFSHEFKTPIVSIRGFAHQLEAGKLDEDQQQEYINIIIAESERLSTMAENVLLLSNLENIQIVSDKTEFDLDEQIRNCILLMQRQWEAKNIQLELDLDDVRYYFNEDMLSHVWINMFNNAIKFTPQDGSISLTMRRTDEGIYIFITDSGVGMTPEVAARIFEKFYQGDKSHNIHGNGIGLNIAKRIIELCGGTISVRSKEGEGTTFVIMLPITVEQEDEDF